MQEYEIIDKVSAVRRQLKTVIWMFFERKDQIAIHTITWAAYQILIDMCEQKGVQREIEDSEILIELGRLNEVITAMRKPHNFFKHSDRDLDETIKFFPDSNYPLILMCCQYFSKLTGDLFIEGKIFQCWFFLKHPERVPKDFGSWGLKLHNISKTISFNDYDFFIELLLKSK